MRENYASSPVILQRSVDEQQAIRSREIPKQRCLHQAVAPQQQEKPPLKRVTSGPRDALTRDYATAKNPLNKQPVFSNPRSTNSTNHTFQQSRLPLGGRRLRVSFAVTRLRRHLRRGRFGEQDPVLARFPHPFPATNGAKRWYC